MNDVLAEYSLQIKFSSPQINCLGSSSLKLVYIPVFNETRSEGSRVTKIGTNDDLELISLDDVSFLEELGVEAEVKMAPLDFFGHSMMRGCSVSSV